MEGGAIDRGLGRERSILERAVHALTEQAVMADALADKAIVAGLGGSDPLTIPMSGWSRLEGSPQAELLRESIEENTSLRDALATAVVTTRSLAG